jgi:hypothetical protein
MKAVALWRSYRICRDACRLIPFPIAIDLDTTLVDLSLIDERLSNGV